MNRLPSPVHDDGLAFESLANNHRVKSFPRLQPIVPAVQAGYVQYANVEGNPAHVQNPAIDAERSNLLRKHYASPSADVAYIKAMRTATAHRVCPMCGSFHSGTLDHYLPQHDFPAYSLLSLNLVPACMCNSKRGSVLLGQEPGERILHPYYDDCLGERLLRAKFEDPGEVPRVGVTLAVPATHPNYAAIAFHFRQVVIRTGICGYLADRWSDLLRRPSLAVRALGQPINSLAVLQQVLEDELDKLDDLHRSKNNWMSLFVMGLLDPPIVNWLFARLSSPVRLPDGPLIELSAAGDINSPT
ncbi:MAG: hypothetical protein E2593_03290 [Stenotrophomonas sp.]|nr:hypothetical protein [Stenotrophomonas sp.]